MTRLLPKFFTKKQAVQVNDLDVQAQAALQRRVARILQHHVSSGNLSISHQMIQSA